MNNLENNLYIFTAITNMHVGSGENNMGVIDNLVQRDALSGLPNINSSGVKGALREFVKANKFDAINIKYIFGPEAQKSKANDDNETDGKGHWNFFNADLLSIPVRSDKVPFLRATSPFIINDFVQRCRLFKVKNLNSVQLDALTAFSKLLGTEQAVVFDQVLDKSIVEHSSVKANFIKSDSYEIASKIFGENLVLVSDSKLIELCNNYNLPVIARNKLDDNGQSENLFYEQIIPRQTRFAWVLGQTPKGDTIETFEALLKNALVQIGGNATIGYGFTEIKRY